MSLNARTVLLTGGAGGLGVLIAERLLGLGADLTVVDRAEGVGYDAQFLQADLSTAHGLDALCARIGNHRWDILINLAGIQYFGPLEQQPAAHLVASYMVNLVAPARLAQAVLPGMKAAGGGHIVNIGSVFGAINFAHFASYSSAKAGLRGLSQALRREVADDGIDVTYVAPRAVRTPLNSGKVMEFARLTRMTMDPPEAVADRIVAAIVERRPDVVIGFPESLFVRVNALFPGLVDAALAGNDRKARTLFAS